MTDDVPPESPPKKPKAKRKRKAGKAPAVELSPEEVEARLQAGYMVGRVGPGPEKQALKKTDPDKIVPLPPAPAGHLGGPPKTKAKRIAGVGAPATPIKFDVGLDVGNLPEPWTIKQFIFALEWLKDPDHNATQAAIKAGYSKKTATSIGSENLTKPHIKDYIAERMRKITDELGLTATWVLNEIHACAAFNMLDYIGIDEDGGVFTDFTAMTRAQGAALRSIEITELPKMLVIEAGIEIEREQRKIKITGQDKLKGLEMLGKHFGMLQEKVLVKHEADITDLDLARYLAFVLTKNSMAKPPGPPGPPPDPQPGAS